MCSRIDLVMTQATYESTLLQPLLAVIRSDELAAAVMRLGGYRTPDLGRVLG